MPDDEFLDPMFADLSSVAEKFGAQSPEWDQAAQRLVAEMTPDEALSVIKVIDVLDAHPTNTVLGASPRPRRNPMPHGAPT